MIDIIYTTWIRSIERLAFLIVTHQSVTRHCRFRDLKHKFHICVEKDSRYIEALREFAENEGIELHFKQTPPSLASMNNFANNIGEYPFIMFMQDDWFMNYPLDINQCIKLISDPEYGVIRLRNNNIQAKYELAKGVYLLDEDAGTYYYSDNPHIKKRDYHDYTGPFKETFNEDGTDNARCENKMNRAAKQLAKDGYKILSLENKFFQHIGSKNTTLTDKVFNR